MTIEFDAAKALDHVLRRDQEATIARWESKADKAAAEGDEEGRAWYQRMADVTRDVAMPWDDGFWERRAR